MSKKVKSILAIGLIIGGIGLFGCNSNSTAKIEEMSSKQTSTNQSKPKKEEVPTMMLNTPMTISTDRGDYNFKIEGTRLTDERNQFSELNAKHVIFLDYNYENVSYDQELYVSEMNFKIMDEEGNVLDTYPVSDTTRYPKGVPVGGKSKGTATYCLENDSKTIKVLFYDNMFLDPIGQMTISTGL